MVPVSRCALMIAGISALGWDLAAGSLQATALKGRVVDSAGRPVAGAEIRVWRQTRPMGGAPVMFAGGDTLLADNTGRFETPDVFDPKTPLRLVAQVTGMLAGRSGWLLPSDDVHELDDIVLVPLRNVVGQVVDGQGAAIAEATVFNGDGHQRVETKSGSTGKFLLENVPENALFLFAEKPGYRLTGTLLGDNKEPELRMSRGDEPIEPIKSRDPVLSADERVVLAHRLLDPYLEAVSQQGNDGDKYLALEALSLNDPAAALRWHERVHFADQGRQEQTWGIIVQNWLKRGPVDDREAIRALLRSSKDDYWAASSLLVGATSVIPRSEPERRREWLDEGLVRARAVPDAARRVVFIAWAATGFSQTGDHERAASLAREAETEAKSLWRDMPAPSSVCARLATAFAPADPPKALHWLDQIQNDNYFSNWGALAAVGLAPIDTANAEEIWNHVRDRAKDRAFLQVRDLFAANFCFKIAQSDAARASRLAAAVEFPFWRVQTRAAVARAARGEAAKSLLQEAVADARSPQFALEPSSFPRPQTAAMALAGALSAAEEVDPQASRELLWRAVSLRTPQPTVSLLDDEWLLADVALAQIIARYEPAIARRLLEPAVELVAQMASAAESAQKAAPLVVAAAFVDPDWAVDVLNRLPEPPDVSWQRHSKNQARLSLVRMLGFQGDAYWRHAGFWEPED